MIIHSSWQDKCHKPNYLPLPLSPDFYCWAQCPMARNTPSISWGHLSWLSVLSATCSLPAYLLGVWIGEKVLTLCKHSPAIAKMLVLLTVFYRECKTQWGKLTPCITWCKFWARGLCLTWCYPECLFQRRADVLNLPCVNSTYLQGNKQIYFGESMCSKA